MPQSTESPSTKLARWRNILGLIFLAPDVIPPLLDAKWFECTFHHTVKCCLCCRSKALLSLAKRYVVSAVISYTSLPHWKGLLLSPSREEDAPRRALHHFRLADETATSSSLAACADAGSSARASGGGGVSAPLEGERVKSPQVICRLLWQPDEAGFETETAKKSGAGRGRREQREWKTLKQSDEQRRRTLFKSFSVAVHQAVALKPLSACRFERKDAALKSKL